MNLIMVPLDFTKDGIPRDAALMDAVQEYAKKELGGEHNFHYYARAHAVLAVDENGTRTVMGLLGIRYSIDVCMFHVTPPTPDKAGYRLAEQARDIMYYRGTSYLQDLGNTGSTVLVYVAENAQRYWRRFLNKINAKPANRFEITI